MTKVDSLRRFLFPCFSTSTTTSTRTTTHHTHHHHHHHHRPTSSTTTKKRLSTSLRDDIPDQETHHHQEGQNSSSSSSSSTEGSVTSHSYPNPPSSSSSHSYYNPPRPSKSMVIGTFYGHRRGHVCFCIQHDRLHSKPSLLLEFSLPTYLFVKELKCGLVRIALESNRSDLSSVPLHSIPIWTMCVNGRKVGFASKRRASDKDRLILKTMKSTTVGAGVIPPGLIDGGGGDDGELIYMRANYERVMGNADSESFHLINPDGFPGHELSIFLLRTRSVD